MTVPVATAPAAGEKAGTFAVMSVNSASITFECAATVTELVPELNEPVSSTVPLLVACTRLLGTVAAHPMARTVVASAMASAVVEELMLLAPQLVLLAHVGATPTEPTLDHRCGY